MLCAGEYRGYRGVRAFCRYCAARRGQEDMRDAYRVYMADCLRMVTESIANFARGTYMRARWSDLIKPQKEETRTGKEVVEHMKSVLGRLEVKQDGCI